MSRGIWRAPSDPTVRLLRCYGDLFPRRPHCACFEHVQNLAATSATLETLLRSAALIRRSMRSHNDPAAISGDLVDFADRSEVAVLCDCGIIKGNQFENVGKMRATLSRPESVKTSWPKLSALYLEECASKFIFKSRCSLDTIWCNLN